MTKDRPAFLSAIGLSNGNQMDINIYIYIQTIVAMFAGAHQPNPDHCPPHQFRRGAEMSLPPDKMNESKRFPGRERVNAATQLLWLPTLISTNPMPKCA